MIFENRYELFSFPHEVIHDHSIEADVVSP